MKTFLLILVFALISGTQSALADCTGPAAPAGRMDYFGAPDNTFKFCDGTDWVDMGASASGGGVVDVQTYTTAGSHTWTKPVTGSVALVEMWGGGGGGGRGGSYYTGGGGGGGAYKSAVIPLSQLGATVSVTVGAGGSAGASNGTMGGDGGDSNFGGLILSYGGKGGYGRTGHNHCSDSTNGGDIGGDGAGQEPNSTTAGGVCRANNGNGRGGGSAG